MSRFNKVIAIVVSICFLASNVSFAAEVDISRLSPPSRFSKLQGQEFKQVAQIQIGIYDALNEMKGLDLETLRGLGVRDIVENTVFSSRVKGKIFFSDVREAEIPGIYVGKGNYIVVATTGKGRYYCLISIEMGGEKYKVSVVPDRVFSEALQEGVVRFAHESVSENDRSIVSAYMEHEISTQGNTSIDDWIRERMLRSEYAVDDASAKDPLYAQSAKTAYHRRNYADILESITQYLRVVGVKEKNIKAIRDTMLSTPLILIPYASEEELPAITISGQPVKVRAHSSQFATYIFVPMALYEHVSVFPRWESGTAEYVENMLVHEIGARCGQKVRIADGRTVNILDEYFTLYASGHRPDSFKVPDAVIHELEDLAPANLLELELRNDYGMGNAKNKSVFKRIMLLVIIPCLAIGSSVYMYKKMTAKSPTAVVTLSNQEREKITGLIEKLGNSDINVSLQAESELVKIGKPAGSLLIQALNNKDLYIRACAARIMGQIRDRDSVKDLLKAAKSKKWQVAVAAIDSLGYIGDTAAVQPLAALLKNEDFRIVKSAAKALTHIGGDEAIGKLLEALRASDWKARAAAIKELGMIGEARAAKSAADLLKDSNDVVREMAAQALQSIGDEKAMPILSEMLKREMNDSVRANIESAIGLIKARSSPMPRSSLDELIKDFGERNDGTRKAAIESVIRIGKPAIPSLKIALNAKDARVRYSATFVLKWIGDKDETSLLIGRFKDEEASIRILAAKTFIERYNEKAITALSELLNSEKDMNVTVASILALKNLRDRRAAPALMGKLEKTNPVFCKLAASALGEIGDRASVDVLIKLLAEDEFVSTDAVIALGAIGDPKAVPALKEALKAAKKGSSFESEIKKALDLIEKAQKIESEEKDQGSTNKGEGLNMDGKAALAEMPSLDAVRKDSLERADRIAEVLWKVGKGELSKKHAMAIMGNIAPEAGQTRHQRNKLFYEWITQATLLMLTMGVIASQNSQPEDADIRMLASRIGQMKIEVFIPKSLLPNNITGDVRRAMESRFGGILRVYQDVEDLAGIIKNPAKSVIMTVDLTDMEVAYLESVQSKLTGVRFLNFEKMDVEAMSQIEYENYMTETLAILLLARAITADEAKDKANVIYRMLAHLLEYHIAEVKKIERYISFIANDEMRPVERLRHILKAILKALPVTTYQVMRRAVEVLWAA